jgi:hypothetical protein
MPPIGDRPIVALSIPTLRLSTWCQNTEMAQDTYETILTGRGSRDPLDVLAFSPALHSCLSGFFRPSRPGAATKLSRNSSHFRQQRAIVAIGERQVV